MRSLGFAMAIVVCGAAAWSGCRGLPKPGAPAAPPPCEFNAGQLKFKCNFELAADHRLVRELIAERDDVKTILGLPYTNEPIHVHLFNDAEAYGEFRARHFPRVPSRRAFFVASDTQLTVYAHWSDRIGEDLRHEVAHGYLHAAVPGLPLWLDEGLAEYFEVPRGQVGLNRPHLVLLREMIDQPGGWRPNIARLETLTDAAQLSQLDYAESWAWVYFLLESEPERRELLRQYLAEFHALRSAEPLSTRLRARHMQPDPVLVEFIKSCHETHYGPVAKSGT